MKAIRIAAAVVGLSGAILSYPAFSALNNVDPNAAVVYLRTSCIEGSSPQVTLNNCFDGSNAVTDLTNWIGNTRQPSASSPLLVEVGPGSYARIVCGNWGYTTFRGAGRVQTIFTSTGSTGALSASSGCTELEFQHLSLKASGFLSKGVGWNSNGNSRWLDVDVIGQMYGWYDTGGGKHYWNSSKIIATGFPGAFAKAYKTVGENWFFGSELHAQATDEIVDVIALEQQGSVSETHFYGSVVRVDASASALSMIALAVTGGSVHVHGTGIDVISTAASNNVTAINASNGAMVHVNGAAYNLSAGQGGTITRIANNGGHVHAPYLWEEHSTPPNVTSADGADVAVLTTSGGTPKFVIYSTTCPSKWYDVGANACRP